MQLFVLSSTKYHAVTVILYILCTRIVVQRLSESGCSADCRRVWLKSCVGAEAAEASTVMREPGQELLFLSLFLTLGYGILYSANPDCAYFNNLRSNDALLRLFLP